MWWLSHSSSLTLVLFSLSLSHCRALTCSSCLSVASVLVACLTRCLSQSFTRCSFLLPLMRLLRLSHCLFLSSSLFSSLCLSLDRCLSFFLTRYPSHSFSPPHPFALLLSSSFPFLHVVSPTHSLPLFLPYSCGLPQTTHSLSLTHCLVLPPSCEGLISLALPLTLTLVVCVSLTRCLSFTYSLSLSLYTYTCICIYIHSCRKRIS